MSPGYQGAANRWLDTHYENECGAVTATSKLHERLRARLEETVKKECNGEAGSKPMSALFWVWKAKVAARQQQTLQELYKPAGTVYSRQKNESPGLQCSCCLKSYLSSDCS